VIEGYPMKRLLIVGAFTLLCSIPLRAQVPTFVYSAACPNSAVLGSGAGGSFSSTPDYRCPLPELSTAGDTIVLFFAYDNGGNNNVFTVTDNKNNTWVLAVTSATSPNGKQMRVYVASNVAAGTAYVNIHNSSGGQSGFWQLTVAEFYNVAASSPIDSSSCNAATSTSVTAGSLGTLGASGDLIYQASYSDAYQSNTSFAAGSQPNITWNLADELLGDGSASQYGVYSSTVSFNPTFTQGTSIPFLGCAVALKAGSSGSAPSAALRVVHQEHDAMPKNAANPWNIGMISTANVVYLSYVGNDNLTSVTSSPSPPGGWVASGADFVGLNGHNHVNFYCAKFSSPPGAITVSLTRGGTTHDSINMMYDVAGATCTVDQDSGGQAGDQTSQVSALTTCSGCLTPTKQNDIIFANMGQGFCTTTSLSSPAGIHDAAFFTGNSIDGATQTDENNGWMHYYNGSSLSPITVTWGETCGSSAEFFWAGRVVAYQSSGAGPPAPPTALSALPH
jgi:hypothetical protein